MSTKIKNTILLYAVVFICSLIPAILFNKYIEAVIFNLLHTAVRPQFKWAYHNIKPEICRTISGNVCFFGISFVLPLSISLLSAILIVYFICYIGSIKAQADYYQNKCEKLQVPNQKAIFDEKCRSAKLSKRDTIIAEKYYFKHETPKEIWLWLCEQREFEVIEWDSIYQLLWRIGKKLS